MGERTLIEHALPPLLLSMAVPLHSEPLHLLHLFTFRNYLLLSQLCTRAAVMSTYDDSISAFCDGIGTILTTQPHHPSYSQLCARRRVLFRAQLPNSSAGNAFTELYDEGGTRPTLLSRTDVCFLLAAQRTAMMLYSCNSASVYMK